MVLRMVRTIIGCIKPNDPHAPVSTGSGEFMGSCSVTQKLDTQGGGRKRRARKRRGKEEEGVDRGPR